MKKLLYFFCMICAVGNLAAQVLPDSLMSKLPPEKQDAFRNHMPKKKIQQTLRNASSDDSNFVIDENGVLVEYRGPGGDVVIPDGVTAIGDWAFNYCYNLTSISIPNSVTSIGNYAFSGCTNLTSVSIPNSVTSVGDYAFSGCTNLASVSIPEGVTSIGRVSFANCSSLTSISIPSSVTFIGEWLFDFCSSLNAINVNNNNPVYKSENGILYDKTKNSLFICPAGKSGDISIPDSISNIEDYAFYYCTKITSISISNSITSIGYGVFYGCSSLENIAVDNNNPAYSSENGILFNKAKTALLICPPGKSGSISIPNSVISTGYDAFYGCNSLENIMVDNNNPAYSSENGILYDKEKTTLIVCPAAGKSKNISIPNSVTYIGSYAFYNCINITSISIPNSVIYIGSYAFSYCSSLASISIPEGVTAIEYNTFSSCINLAFVSIPNSVTSIGNGAFSNCSSLTSVSIPEGVTAIGYDVFYYCTNLASVSIPNSVTSIGSYAFYNCNSLVSISIPNNVTSIGDIAFYYCSSLKNIYLLAATPPAIYNSTFDLNTYSTCMLHVPKGTKQAYETTEFWKRFSDIQEQPLTPVDLIITAQADKDIYLSSDTIFISGTAKYDNNTIAKDIKIEVGIEVMGYKRVYQTVTDENGNYQIKFKPQEGEAGHYRIMAYQAGEPSSTIKDEFEIPGMKLSSNDWILWEVEQGVSKQGAISFTNRSAMPLHNVRIETITTSPNARFSFKPISTLDGNSAVQIDYEVTGIELTTSNDWEEIKLRVISDEGVSCDFSVFFYCKRARGVLETTPYELNAYMTLGKSKIIEFDLYNHGNAPTGTILVSIPPVEWMELVTSDTISSLAPNDSAKISIRLKPTQGMALNVPFTGNIAINCENGRSTTIPFNITAVSESTGKLVVDVVDEYYYNTTEAPHLANAHVKLRHPYTLEIVAEGYTDTNGLFVVDDLPEGYYTLFVEAEKHSNYQNNILIEPGQTNNQWIFTSFQAISYSWMVVPTEIEDEYTVKLITKFETNVPVPVITMNVPENLPELNEGEEYTFTITLTNHGLIAAHDISLNIPELDDYLFTILIEDIKIIEPHQSIEIPVLMTKKLLRDSGSDRKCKFSFGGIAFYYCDNHSNWIRFLSIPMKIGVEVNCGIEDIIKEVQKSWPIIPIGDFDGEIIGGCSNCVDIPEIVSLEDCEPCVKTIGGALIGCIPGLDCAAPAFVSLFNIGFDHYYGKKLDIKEQVKDLLIETSKCLVTTSIETLLGVKLGSCVFDIVKAISDCIQIESIEESKLKNSYTNPFLSIYNDLRQYQQYLNIAYNAISSIFPINTWGNVDNIDIFCSTFFDNLDDSGIISEEGIKNVINSYSHADITENDIRLFAERWNRSVTYWNNEYYNVEDLPEGYNQDFIQLSSFHVDELYQIYEYYTEKGFNNLGEMVNNSFEYLENYVEQSDNSVCASVSLQIDQKLAMTREAFRGTLTLYNGHETIPMENISLNLVIKDDNGTVSNQLFQIETEKLAILTGIDGSGILNAQTSGTATILFIPTINAAPTESKFYSFGGTLSYLDPFSGTEVTVDLFPVRLEVAPSPDLYLHYFIQRDIFGDDPLTEPIEPSIPAEFAVMIQNQGKGIAKNVKISSAQPEIIENEKGLLIDIMLTGSSLDEKPANLGLLDVDFGNVDGGKTAIGQWYFTSSLLGHFMDYKASVVHLNGYGNDYLSLVGGIDIHELIKSIKLYENNPEKRTSFLVNDVVDAEDTPDRLYLPDGSTANVYKAEAMNFNKNLSQDTETIQLTLTPSNPGWNYGKANDLGNGNYKLVKIVREDNQEIPLENCWLTNVEMRDGKEPQYVNRIHIVDKINASTVYYLTFEKESLDIPVVISIEGASTYETEKVKSLKVIFNKPIVSGSFTADAVSFYHDGKLNPSTYITISKISDMEFLLDISALTQSEGYYKVIIRTDEISDNQGNKGKYGKECIWVQVLDNVGIENIEQKDYNVIIYPNPVGNEFILHFENPKNETVYVSIYDSSGKRKEQRMVTETTSFNTSQYHPGIYFIRVFFENSGNVIMKKVIKK